VLLDHTQYWVQGFKEVSLMMVSDILTQLELEVNNYLYSFGLHDWKIEFSVDSVTKTGKARKGFAVTIKPPHAEASVPWNSYSGGETQRLRLAGALGLSDLILACFGLMPGLEAWDEPSQFLTTQGVNDLVQSLRDRALSTSRQIFLIDHRNLDAGKFDGIYTVVKTNDNVVVEKS
jgi:DNA repair exonuclease SbcCD ATPase subunit